MLSIGGQGAEITSS